MGNRMESGSPARRLRYNKGDGVRRLTASSFRFRSRRSPSNAAHRRRYAPKGQEENPLQPRISMITLGVRDLSKAIAFYEHGLGFPRMDSPPDVAFFTLNGTWLGLFGREALAEDATISPDGQGFNAFALAHKVESVVEVDAVVQQAATAGATIVKYPVKASWGGYSGYFKDLDGHPWEVAHNPHFWVGPRDSNAK